jgi:hypothetical protein
MRSRLCEIAQKLHEHCAHHFGLFPLHPMSGAIDKMESHHMRAGGIAHLVHRARRHDGTSGYAERRFLSHFMRFRRRKMSLAQNGKTIRSYIFNEVSSVLPLFIRVSRNMPEDYQLLAWYGVCRAPKRATQERQGGQDLWIFRRFRRR